VCNINFEEKSPRNTHSGIQLKREISFRLNTDIIWRILNYRYYCHDTFIPHWSALGPPPNNYTVFRHARYGVIPDNRSAISDKKEWPEEVSEEVDIDNHVDSLRTGQRLTYLEWRRSRFRNWQKLDIENPTKPERNHSTSVNGASQDSSNGGGMM
jgi:hypothetical protein